MREVVLTDDLGNATGTTDIQDAHTGAGRLHLAFSVYIFRDERKELLMQQRTTEKFFGLLWANTCCSHPNPDEPILAAGKRRLKEECGIEDLDLKKEGSLVYKAHDPEEKGVEHEFDVLLTADIHGDIALQPNPIEIADMRWEKVETIVQEMKENPKKYAPWFLLGLKKLVG
jgi:isopentenyl-diphosphate Delta-isomerase